MKYRRKFYVVFKNINKPKWWNWFLHKKFNHCFLLCAGPVENTSIMINPTTGGIGMYYYSKNANDMALEATQAGYIVAEYMARDVELINPRFKFFRTCVGICKDFLGINKWWIITPKQLCEEVSKNG